METSRFALERGESLALEVQAPHARDIVRGAKTIDVRSYDVRVVGCTGDPIFEPVNETHVARRGFFCPAARPRTIERGPVHYLRRVRSASRFCSVTSGMRMEEGTARNGTIKITTFYQPCPVCSPSGFPSKPVLRRPGL